MGERRFVIVSFGAGDMTTQHRRTAPDLSVEERFNGMLAEAEERLGPGVSALWIVCDGCGRRTSVSEPELPAGWVDTPKGDFCPECARQT